MTRTHPITASIGIELILNLTATHTHITAQMSDLNSPENLIEDVAIEAVLHDYYVTDNLTGRACVLTHDLLAGVDTSNPHVQTLLSNLLICVNDAAKEALLAEVGE